MTEKITVLLVDDHALVRRGFRRLLEDDSSIVVVGEASNGDEAIRLVGELNPRVVVMDAAMPGTSGLAATRAILASAPEVAILILSMHSEETLVRQAMEAGARGYILKSALDLDLAVAVKRVAAGETVLDPALARSATPTGERNRLTPRELEVLQMICNGLSNRAIAATLNLSVNTVAVHRANIMNTLASTTSSAASTASRSPTARQRPIVAKRAGCSGIVATAFEDLTATCGIFDSSSKSLGVALVDFDQDGWPDIFVANDTQPNKLYRNLRNGTFKDVALEAGVALSEDGKARAGMGVDAADFDNSGGVGLAVTNFEGEMIGLYRAQEPGRYQDVATRTGVGAASRNRLGFGCVFADVDLDGATVRIYHGGVSQTRVVKSGSSYLSQSELPVTFGVGRRDRVERVIIAWPSGRTEEVKDLASGHAYECVEGKACSRLY